MAGEVPSSGKDEQAFLEGLAGRAGSGAEHAEGARLRRALQPEGDVAAAAARWADIEKRALAAGSEPENTQAAGTQPQPQPLVQLQPQARGRLEPARDERHARAANDEAPRMRPWGWAAMALAALGLALVLPRWAEEPASRGAAPAEAAAQWLVRDPGPAAEALAAELRGLAAQVRVKPEGNGFVLEIAAPAAAIDKVNARLMPLETALDREGRLVLRVQAQP